MGFRRAALWAVGVLALATGGWTVLYPQKGQVETTTSSVSSSPPAIAALGRLQPESEIRVISSPTNGGFNPRIGRLLVDEGDFVEKGQILAELDTLKNAESDVVTAQADIELKKANLARVEHQFEADLEARKMAVARSEADLAVKNSVYARAAKLGAKKFESEQNVEARRLERDLAARTLEENKAQLKRLVAERDNVPIDVAVAQRELVFSEAALTHAMTAREDALARAPIAGRVLRINTRAGERVSTTDGLLELGDTNQMIALVEIYDTDVGRASVGAACEVWADSLGEKPLTGKVARISQSVKRQSVVNSDPAANTDLRVVEVRIALDEDSIQRAAPYSRMQVRARCEAAPAKT
ncbi:MAG TPA: HlyD family efflux transporter periplasmic adaptor subunit [Methylocystis sp.]|nr:HlyD family efflux transporter periplasmic adaptor subunit [Methylocystis sp.]